MRCIPSFVQSYTSQCHSWLRLCAHVTATELMSRLRCVDMSWPVCSNERRERSSGLSLCISGSAVHPLFSVCNCSPYATFYGVVVYVVQSLSSTFNIPLCVFSGRHTWTRRDMELTASGVSNCLSKHGFVKPTLMAKVTTSPLTSVFSSLNLCSPL